MWGGFLSKRPCLQQHKLSLNIDDQCSIKWRLNAVASASTGSASIAWVNRRASRFEKLLHDVAADLKTVKQDIKRALAVGDARKVTYLRQVLDDKFATLRKLQKTSKLTPLKVAQQVLGFADVLGLSVEATLDLVRRCDRLITLKPASLRDIVHELAALLSISFADAVQLASIKPAVLLYSVNGMRNHITQLSDNLGLSRQQLLQMLAERPELLTQCPHYVRTKVSELQAILNLSSSQAVDVVVRCPRLLRNSPDTMRMKFQKLQHLLESPSALVAELVVKEPRILCLTTDVAKRKLQGLLFKFAMFQDEVVDMMLADPSVFMAEPVAESLPSQRRPSKHTLVDPFLELASALDLPPVQVLESAMRNSAILGLRRDDLKGQLQALSQLLSISYAEAATMLCNEPTILAWTRAKVPMVVDAISSMPAAGQTSTSEATALPIAATAIQQGSSRPAGAVEPPPVASSATGGQQQLSPPFAGRIPRPVLQPAQPTAGPSYSSFDAGEQPPAAGPSYRSINAREQLPAAAVAVAPAAAGLYRSMASAREQVASLQELLCVEEEQIRDMVQQVPELLMQPFAAMQARVQLLKDTLRLPDKLVGEIVAATPRVLLQNPDRLRRKLGQMQAALSLSPGQLRELISREPQLLNMTAEDLRRRYEKLAERFGLFSDDVMDVIMADPSILCRVDNAEDLF